MRSSPLLLVLAGLLAPSAAQAESVTWKDVELTGQVLIVTSENRGRLDEVSVTWRREGVQHVTHHVVRPGTHAYEMRDLDGWRGRASAVRVFSYQGRMQAALRRPTPADEIEIGLTPQPWIPRGINLLDEVSLFRLPWLVYALALGAAVAVFAIRRGKKRWPVAAAIGVAAACLVMDLRGAWDHAFNVQQIGGAQGFLYVLTDTKRFADRARELIGQASWRDENLLPLERSMLVYSLAEQRYSPDPSQADYVITYQPKQRPVVLREGRYFLVRVQP